MNDPPNRAETIVDGALDLPAEERAAFLDQQCGADAHLRGLVEGLLLAHHKAPNPCLRSSAPVPESTIPLTLPISEKPGDWIGRYKLLQQVGEGGCGVVYMAEQEEPVRRRVALKVIKLGMDTKQVIARFEAERQALALMDHPNIAKVLDAGATETGRPYFVMELVRGIKITEYCDQANLTTEKRLDLFAQVCKAIQHAHQKGIIHRDIKPSNILVTLHDGVPVPKVIDFGIAKATEQRLTDKTLFTALEQFIGTPAYMSPEQAEMSGLDIDTRSDIYSLGVLLYELLTGQMPFEAKELLASGLQEMRRIIRETDPVRPSTRLSSLDAVEQTTVARRRQVEAPKLVHQVRGDLDWIVMKCLEKDRTRRYETAAGLASDVERHLNNEPVTASPPSASYRLGKMVRRNRVFFAAAAAVFAALVAGLGLSAWMYAREKAAKRQASAAEKVARSRAIEARESADESTAILGFFQENVLKAARPEGESGGLGKDITLRAAIKNAEPSIGSFFSNQPIVEATIRNTLGESFQHLGDFPAAIKQHQRAVELFREQRGPDYEGTLLAITSLASALSNIGSNGTALALLEGTLARMEASASANVTNKLTVMHNLALTLLYAGKHGEAVTLLEKVVGLRKDRLGVAHAQTLSSMAGLAMAYGQLGHYSDALSLLKLTYDLAVTNLGPTNPETLAITIAVGNAYHRARRLDEALPLLRQAFEQRTIIYGADAPVTLTALNNLAMLHLEMGKALEAVPLLERILIKRREILEPLHPDTLSSIHNLASGYRETGRFEEALPLSREAIASRTQIFGSNSVHTLRSREGLGLAYRGLRDYSNAAVTLEAVVALSSNCYSADSRFTLSFMHNLVSVYEAAGRTNDALALLMATTAGYKRAFGVHDADTQREMKALAAAYCRAGHLRESEEEWHALLEAQQKSSPAGSAVLIDTLYGLGEVLLKDGKPEAAEPFASNGLAIAESKLPKDWRTSNLRSLLGRTLAEQKKYSEAKSLLVTGYEGLRAAEAQVPVSSRHRVREAGDWVVQLFDASHEPDQAAKWRALLGSQDPAPQNGSRASATPTNAPPGPDPAASKPPR